MRRLAAAGALLLAGCSTLERLMPESPGAASRPPVSAANPAPVSEARAGSDIARVRNALAVLANPNGDEAEALAHLEPLLKRSGGDPDARAMAGFLQAMVLERRKLRESASGAAARLREERKATEVQKLRADALQERATELQQKLEGLADLEKSLSDRQGPNR